MTVQPAPVYILSGPPKARKSTITRLLMPQFPFGMHLEVDHPHEAAATAQTILLDTRHETHP